MSYYSRAVFTGNGSTVEYTYPFPVLNIPSIEVRVAGLLKTITTDYSVNLSTSKVTFVTAPANGAQVSIKRVTPRTVDGRAVVFSDPSDLNAKSLNDSALQLLYIIQEALDDISDGIGVADSGVVGVPSNIQDALDALNEAIVAEHNAAVAALATEI